MYRPDVAGPELDEAATAELVAWCEEVRRTASSPFAAARQIVRRLGARPVGEAVAFGFYAPEIDESRVLAGDVFLEVLDPEQDLDPTVNRQRLAFRRRLIPLRRAGEFLFGVVQGLTVGGRERIGSFYQVRFRDRENGWRTIPDYLAASVPFGAFAPAEVYDLERLDRERGDRAYFQALEGTLGEDGVPRLGPPVNILQIHTPTATAGGTLQSLTRLYQHLARKVAAGQELLPDEEVHLGYDAIQLMPVEPTIEYEAGPGFWNVVEGQAPESPRAVIELRVPDMTNWGYDIVISASSAVNPAILASGRPDELVDLAVTLHTFPRKPIRLILDVVFGHADNQAIPLMSRHFFAGPNMYGQDLNYRNPEVRAILLEMQRRKVDFGADGVRVDGAQDFKWWDAAEGVLRHDDDYLLAMSEVVQEVAGVRYRPWMIFEDGRPWPQEDWELSSTYRAVIDQQPHVFQWGPLTFAHNTPALYTFWISKLWRIDEMVHGGSHWISGCANHDTLRRGTQLDPEMRINTRLGDTLLEILDNAYDNPVANMFTYGFLPGVPMDFINASMRASWGFIRNTDDRYGVKVVAEEAISLAWQVDEMHFNRTGNFRRLKELGFEELGELKRFMRMLSTAVVVTDYHLDAIVRLLDAVDPPLVGHGALSIPHLKRIARAWMDDMHDYCNVAYYREDLSPVRTGYNRALRDFRRARPWLRENIAGPDVFDRRWPCDGTVLFYGLRHAPGGGEQILFVANMEGRPVTLDPVTLPIRGLAPRGFEVAIATPRLAFGYGGGAVELQDGDGLLLTRKA